MGRKIEKVLKSQGFQDDGGDGGIRTLDLTDANRTLSQLSYAPIYDRCSEAASGHPFLRVRNVLYQNGFDL